MGIDNLVDMGYTLIEGKEVVKYLPNTKNLINSFQRYNLPDNAPQAYVAGGFVRDIYSQMVVNKEWSSFFKDIDFFVPNCLETLPRVDWWDDLDISDQFIPFFESLEAKGWKEKDGEDYPQDHANGVMAVYGNQIAMSSRAVPVDLIFRTEKTMHDVLHDFDYDAVKGIINPVTLDMYVSPEMVKFFEEKDTSSIPDRATDFKYKLWSISNDWKDKGSKAFGSSIYEVVAGGP